jgi:hypothetical protein
LFFSTGNEVLYGPCVTNVKYRFRPTVQVLRISKDLTARWGVEV